MIEPSTKQSTARHVKRHKRAGIEREAREGILGRYRLVGMPAIGPSPVMRFVTFAGVIAIATAIATPAPAELREFCASRPGLGTPACTVDPGHVVVEIGLADWTLDKNMDERTDTVLVGDTLVRIGLDELTEAQVGWTPYGHIRLRDRASGIVSSEQGNGDVTLGLRRSISGPNGPIAIQPFMTLPVGGSAIGAGNWGAGVIVPIGFDLGHDVQLSLSPEVDVAVNESGSGRHLAYGSVVGLSAPLTGKLSGTVELQAMRDDEPSGSTTMANASASLAWLLGDHTQLDVGAVAGLNQDSPDIEAYFGIARRF